MLKIDNITIAYKDVPTVMDFSLHMAQGQIVSLVGESGSGKTTVIRAVLGLLAGGGKVTKGDILFNASLLVNGESYKNIDLSSGITREYTTEVQLQQAIEKVTKKKSFIPRILTVFIIIILLLVLLILRIRYVKRRRSFLKRRHKIRKKHNF